MVTVTRALTTILLIILIVGLGIGSPMALEWRDNYYAIQALCRLQEAPSAPEPIDSTWVALQTREPLTAQSAELAGHLLWAREDYGRAREAFLRSTEMGSGRATTQFFIGWSHVIEGHPALAADYLRRVGFRNEYLRERVYELYKLGKYDEAIRWSDVAVAHSPHDTAAQCQRAFVYAYAGRLEEILHQHLASVEQWVLSGEPISLHCLYTAGFWAMKNAGITDLSLRLWQPILAICDKTLSRDQSINIAQISYLHLRIAMYWRDKGDVEQERFHLQQAVYWGEGIDTWYTQNARTRLDDVNKGLNNEKK